MVRRSIRLSLALASLVSAVFGCGDGAVPATPDAGRDAGGLPDAGATFLRREPWVPVAAPDVGAPLFEEAPWLRDDASGWRTSFDPATGTPTRATRGAIGLGNGHVFGFVGIGEPDLATLHEAVGLAYDKGDAFFSDVVQEVRVDGTLLVARAQHQWRVRGTAIAVTVTRYDGLDVIGVDAAPLVRARWGAAASPEERALVRLVAAVATDAAPQRDVRVTLRGHETYEADADGAIRQRRSGGARTARLALPLGTAQTDVAARALTLVLGELAPGAEARGLFSLVISSRPADELETLAALGTMPPLALLTSTRDGFRARVAEGATIEAPLPMLVDLVDALRVSLLVQQGANGAICPMSEYTRTWLRDTIGPVVGLAALGHSDAVAAALDYQWVATVENGDLRNSMRADLDVPSPLPADPGFAALGPLTGRTRAEGPSWVVLAHDELARWTGDRRVLEARWPLLLRAAQQQEVDTDGRVPFSGDETYRTAMAIALGHAISESFETGFRSLEAGALLVVACERLAGHADALGRGADADALRALATRVRTATDATYERASDGVFLPYVEPTGALAAGPFEDASLAPPWLGYLDEDPARLRRATRGVWDANRTDQGFPMAPPAARSARTLPAVARAGLYTGMSPGMFLGACARGDLAEGDGALDAIARIVSTTGSVEEYQTFSEHGSLALTYDAIGMLGEYTARYRPWEGGIVVRAMLDWLFGVEPRSLSAGGALQLRAAPHVPPGWSGYALRGVRLADARLDVTVQEAVGGDGTRTRTVGVARTGGTAALSITLGLRAAGTDLAGVTIDGLPVDGAALAVERDDGRLRFDTPQRALADGETATLVVAWR